MRISDWSSDVCSSDLVTSTRASFHFFRVSLPLPKKRRGLATHPTCRLSRSIASKPAPMMHSVAPPPMSITSRRLPFLGGCSWVTPRLKIGRTACQERVCPDVYNAVYAVALTHKPELHPNTHHHIEES